MSPYVLWFMGCAPMALSEEKAALSNCWRFASWGRLRGENLAQYSRNQPRPKRQLYHKTLKPQRALKHYKALKPGSLSVSAIPGAW